MFKFKTCFNYYCNKEFCFPIQQENEAKKNDKKANGAHHPPLQTASTNVRALIEEKINQKRNFMPQTTAVQGSTALETNTQPQGQTFNFQTSQASNQPQNSNFITQVSPILSPVSQETPIFNSFPPTSQSSDLDSLTNNNFDVQSCDILKKLDLKEHFRVPHPPAEKHRRHSDSDHFIHPKRPCTTFTSSALADLLRSRVVAKRTCRTGSDPGESLSLDTPAFSDFTDSLSSVNDLPKFSSLVPSSLGNSMDDTSSDLPQHDLTAITPEDAALPVLSAEDIPEAQPMIMSMRDISELDTHCLERNVFFDTSNNDLGVSQTFPEISVSELEMMQFTSVPTSSAPTSSEVKPINGEKARGGEDSNDDDVFLSPTSLPTSPMKLKKKRRPEVNIYIFYFELLFNIT